MEILNSLNHNKLSKKSGIYLILCIENGKIYVGSSCDLYKRLHSHKRALFLKNHQNKYLQNSYNKYGEGSFFYFVLEFVNNDILLKKEDHYIKHYKSYDPEIGFNIFQNASTTKGNKWSKEAREKRKGFGKGRKNTEESKLKMSIRRKGIKLSQESKDKISKSQNIPIVMLDLEGNFIREWNSAKEASLWLKITPSVQICSVLNGKSKTCKGFNFIRKSEYDPNKNYKTIKGKRVPVLQFTLDGKLIREFPSIIEAANFVNDATTNISKCCKCERKTCKGFIWKYKK